MEISDSSIRDHLDAHARPPEDVKRIYKKYQKLKPALLDAEEEEEIIDIARGLTESQRSQTTITKQYLPSELEDIFLRFERKESSDQCEHVTGGLDINAPVPVYQHAACPGLLIIPSLFPLRTQHILLSRLLHRDLCNQNHLTNIHTHYSLTYPQPTTSSSSSSPSFFSLSPSSPTPPCHPKDPSLHRPLSAQSLLDRKLRWVTLGGQYDWTKKEYPSSSPPPTFPSDIGEMLHSLFPTMRPEAAICNLYTPGDTLSMHRDVSEFCDAPLVSVSLGCDAIFIIKARGGDGDEEDEDERTKPLVIKLHSGDAVYMSGNSRFAWHGVPRVIPGTCPEVLAEWPGKTELTASLAGADADTFDAWKGWMRRKRINLNVRQMAS